MKPIARFHYLTQDGVPGFSPRQQVRLACDLGVEWIQIRTKVAHPSERQAVLESCIRAAEGYTVTLIVNDYTEWVAPLGAHGVHLGLEDGNPGEARKKLGVEAILGLSSHNPEEIARGVSLGADYLGLGPYRFTRTKNRLDPVLGLETLRSYVPLAGTTPLIAIGGVEPSDIELLLEAGVHGVAVSSAVNRAPSPAQALGEFLHPFRFWPKERIA